MMGTLLTCHSAPMPEKRPTSNGTTTMTKTTSIPASRIYALNAAQLLEYLQKVHVLCRVVLLNNFVTVYPVGISIL
jgi:hypothetical protein